MLGLRSKEVHTPPRSHTYMSMLSSETAPLATLGLLHLPCYCMGSTLCHYLCTHLHFCAQQYVEVWLTSQVPQD